MTSASAGHDIVVIGASAGGVEALRELVGGLPPDFSGSLFVVLHMPPNLPSHLARILQRAGPLPAVQVMEPQVVSPGTIYVAPPNQHLIVHRGHVQPFPGPRENSARPSVDVLFRSAARAYGPRVIGVILSGTLNDGALGLAAINLRGGVTIVQDPQEAMFAGMPESALSAAPAAYCLPVAEIPLKLVELARHHFEHVPMDSNFQPIDEPTTVHAADEPDETSPKLPNAASGLTCPECHGSLWELSNGESLRYECRVGHTYGVDALMTEQGEAVEAALWAAINSLQERAGTFRRLLEQQRSAVAPARDYDERAERTEAQAGVLHDLLKSLIAEGLLG